MIMSAIDAAASTAKMGQELYAGHEKNIWVLIGIAVLLMMYFMLVFTKNFCVFIFKIVGSIFGIVGLSFGLLIFDDKPRRRRRRRYF